MANGHNHGHDHGIGTANSSQKKALSIVLVLTTLFMLVEAGAGFYTSSLALLSDAAHMLTDVFAILVAYVAIWITQRPASDTKTYGYYRAEIIGAFFNSLLLFIISGGILVEAVKRIQHPETVKSLEMTVVAILGLLINLTSAYILFRYQSGNLNIKGALYHVMSDALGSVGAIVAGLIMITTQWYYADSIVSMIVSVLIIRAAWMLFRESVHILLEGTPKGLDLKAVQSSICSCEGVVSVHDLHVWTLTQGFESLSAHLVVEDIHKGESLIREIKSKLFEKFNIAHVTLQVETENCEDENGQCFDNSKNDPV